MDGTAEASPPGRYRTWIEAASLVTGPFLMTAGDLIHPDESMDAAAQAAIVTDHASRWYTAHLLLLLGMLLVIPGILALTRLAGERKPAAGYVARVFMLAGAGALSAVFGIEMLIGRFVSSGADAGNATALLQAFQSGHVLGALLPGVLLFFVGSALFTVPLAITGGAFRWPAILFALGALLILIEVLSARVLLSQIGNTMALAASVWFARLLTRTNHADGPAQPGRPPRGAASV